MRINRVNDKIIMFTLYELEEVCEYMDDIKVLIICKIMITKIKNEFMNIISNNIEQKSNTDLSNAIKKGLIIDQNTFDYVKNHLLFSLYIKEDNETLNKLKEELEQNDILKYNLLSIEFSIEQINQALLHSIRLNDSKEEIILRNIIDDIYKGNTSCKSIIKASDLLKYGIDICIYISYFSMVKFENKMFEKGMFQRDEDVLIFDGNTFVIKKAEGYENNMKLKFEI